MENSPRTSYSQDYEVFGSPWFLDLTCTGCHICENAIDRSHSPSLYKRLDSCESEVYEIDRCATSTLGKITYSGGFFAKAGRSTVLAGGSVAAAFFLSSNLVGWTLGLIGGVVFLTSLITQYIFDKKVHGE